MARSSRQIVTHTCDRCGNVVEKSSDETLNTWGSVQSQHHSGSPIMGWGDKHDLCDDCCIALKKWFDNADNVG